MDESLRSFSPLDVSEAFKEHYRRQRDLRVQPYTTPLHVATLHGDHARVQQLVESRRVAVSARDANGYTALHHAALLGHEHIAAVLIDHGALVGVVALDGNTPLHKAAQGGHVALARLLLAHGATVKTVNKLGEFPIDVCAKRKHTAMTAFLRGYVGPA